MSIRRIAIVSIVLSIVAFAFLSWLIYIKAPASSEGLTWVAFLPTCNAIFNTLSTLCIIAGILAIRRGYKKAHAIAMASALTFSGFFLVSYVVYHHFQGDTIFTGTGIIRPIYFFILISHIVLTAVALPMIFGTVGLAITKKFDAHRKLARWTYPLWLYISVTGVLIYVMLNF
jgi:putative membrane protein